MLFQLNTGAVGFYRTQYSSEMLESLLPGIRNGTLPPRDRLGLGNDLFALVGGDFDCVKSARMVLTICAW